MIVRSAERSWSASIGTMPIQIVGTPAATVTFSDSISPIRVAGDRSGPGITNDAPARNAAYGRPQAFAWNIGTTGRTRSASRRENVEVVSAAFECSHIERWL